MLQQIAGHSDKVTIEQRSKKVTPTSKSSIESRRDSLFTKSSKTEEMVLLCLKIYRDVVSMFDVEGCACDLFMRGPGN